MGQTDGQTDRLPHIYINSSMAHLHNIHIHSEVHVGLYCSVCVCMCWFLFALCVQQPTQTPSICCYALWVSSQASCCSGRLTCVRISGWSSSHYIWHIWYLVILYDHLRERDDEDYTRTTSHHARYTRTRLIGGGEAEVRDVKRYRFCGAIAFRRRSNRTADKKLYSLEVCLWWCSGGRAAPLSVALLILIIARSIGWKSEDQGRRVDDEKHILHDQFCANWLDILTIGSIARCCKIPW